MRFVGRLECADPAACISDRPQSDIQMLARGFLLRDEAVRIPPNSSAQTMQVIDLRCPGCGAPCTTSTPECEYCRRKLVITEFSDLVTFDLGDLAKLRDSYTSSLQGGESPSLHLALGLVYLKMGLFEQAQNALAQSIERQPAFSEVYFYAAAAQLAGQRPFLAGLSRVQESQRLVGVAFKLETRAIYCQFLAFLAHDYYERKFLNHEPHFQELVQKSKELGLSRHDSELLAKILAVPTVDISTN
jgi:hypothetical protein